VLDIDGITQDSHFCDPTGDFTCCGTGGSDIDGEWRHLSAWQREDAVTARQVRAHRSASSQLDSTRGQRREDLFEFYMITLADTRTPALLSELASTYGMSWIDLSTLVGVTIPAIRKWRLGGATSEENEEKLRALVAFVKAVATVRNTPDPVNWLDERLVPGFAVTVKDLYSPQNVPVLLAYANGDFADAKDLLNEVRPNWRSEDRTGFEVRDIDGHKALVTRRPADGR